MFETYQNHILRLRSILRDLGIEKLLAPAADGRYCAKCGQERTRFGIFCARCMAPLVRCFKTILIFEILLFLSLSICLASAHQNILAASLVYVSTFFLTQLAGLFLLRCSIRERRYLILIALMIVLLIVCPQCSDVRRAFLATGSLFVGFGSIALWWTTRSLRSSYNNLQQLWLCVLLGSLGLAFSVGLASDVFLRAFAFYSPWGSLAGLSLTLAVKSGMRVAERGIYVKENYFPDVRIPPATSLDTTSYPRLFLPFALVPHALRRAGTAFYNTMTTSLNFLVRSAVYAGRTIHSLACEYLVELGRSIRIQAAFVRDIVRWLVVPFVGIFAWVLLSLRIAPIVDRHAFDGQWASALLILLFVVCLFLALLFAVSFFCRGSIMQLLDTMTRDAAAVAGYGIALFLACGLTLRLLSLAVYHYTQFDLGFRFGQLSALALVTILLVLWLLRRRTRHSAGLRDADIPGSSSSALRASEVDGNPAFSPCAIEGRPESES